MVSFTSITHGVLLLSIAIIGLSEANDLNNEQESQIESTVVEGYTLPPYISERTQLVVPNLDSINLNGEADNMRKNIKWILEKGVDFVNMTQHGYIENVNGMALDIPADIPSLAANSALNRLNLNSYAHMILATPSQVEHFKLYAGVASTAYCRSVTGLLKWDCENCKKYVPDGEIITTFSTPFTDVTGFVLRSDEQKVIHVVFRGDSSIRNVIAEAITAKMDYPAVKGSKVHAGMYLGYKEVVKSFFPYVQEQLISHPDYRVDVSGHSLGGAQALFAGLDLYQREPLITTQNLRIYTFGAPRVGDGALAYYIDSTTIPIYRSVHNRDLLPHFPPQELGYIHSGAELWEIPQEGLHICPSNIESSYCSNTIVPFTNLFDHTTYYDINEGSCL